MIECSIEDFVPVSSYQTRKAVLSIEFSSARGNFELEQEVDDTMLNL